MKKLLFLIIVILLLGIFRGPILTAYANLFRLDTATQGADIMIVLSGNIATRPRHAAKLYDEGYANRVLLTREKNWEGFASPYVEDKNNYAEYYLLKHEVPVEFLPSTHEEGAMSTMDEALDTIDYLKQHTDILHVTLLTDAFHTYRAHYMFKKLFNANGLSYIQLEMAAAPNKLFDQTNWFKTEKGLVEYFKETIKVPMYWMGLANMPAVVAH